MSIYRLVYVLLFLYFGMGEVLGLASSLGVCDLTFPALVREPCVGMTPHRDTR